MLKVRSKSPAHFIGATRCLIGESKVKTVFTNKGEPIYVDDWNYDWLNQYTWHLDRQYAKARVNGEMVVMARLIGSKMGLNKSKEVDHEDQVPQNNQEYNLREATHSQNQANRSAQRNSKTGLKGVSWHRAQRSLFQRFNIINEKYILVILILQSKPQKLITMRQRSFLANSPTRIRFQPKWSNLPTTFKSAGF